MTDTTLSDLAVHDQTMSDIALWVILRSNKDGLQKTILQLMPDGDIILDENADSFDFDTVFSLDSARHIYKALVKTGRKLEALRAPLDQATLEAVARVRRIVNGIGDDDTHIATSDNLRLADLRTILDALGDRYEERI